MNFEFSIGKGADILVNYILDHFTPLLDAISAAIGLVTGSIQQVLLSLPPLAGIIILAALSLWRVGGKFAIFTLIAMALVLHMGLWSGMMQSLSLVLAATIIAMLIGIPLGIWMARS